MLEAIYAFKKVAVLEGLKSFLKPAFSHLVFVVFSETLTKFEMVLEPFVHRVPVGIPQIFKFVIHQHALDFLHRVFELVCLILDFMQGDMGTFVGSVDLQNAPPLSRIFPVSLGFACNRWTDNLPLRLSCGIFLGIPK